MKSKFFLAVIASCCFFANACAPVKPWQRATLADPIMRSDRDPVGDMLRAHVYSSREASSGGASVGGSGCGCN